MDAAQQEHLETLKTLSPLEAIHAWLADTVAPGDRSALAVAIQKDRRIELDDDEIAYLLEDAVEEGIDARTVLERLLSAGDGLQLRSSAHSDR